MKKKHVFKGWFPKEWVRNPNMVFASIILNERERMPKDVRIKLTMEVYK